MYVLSSGAELDGGTRGLRVNGRTVALDTRSLDLLLCLVRERARVLPAEDLWAAVWGAAPCDPTELHRAVRDLRATLRETGAGDPVRGDVRRGYRYVGPVREEADAPGTAAADAETQHGSRIEPRARLPVATTACLGREAEIEAVLTRLADPSCRLLTLVGPGGVGKSRLALEVARQAAPLGQAPLFVDLQPVRSAELVAAAIAEAAGLTFQGSARPRDQLVRYLQQGRRLLVLDTMEHLLDGVDLLAQIAVEAPNVTLLVTSREVLGLDEWVVPVEPLPLPGDDAVDPENAAMRLFAERAARVRPDFDAAAEQVAVARICRLVGGLPLALELAAAWIGTLSTAQIAEEVERTLDFLVTTRRDVPERHRSMAAVFEHSWGRLSDAEAAMLARLSVFYGRFSHDAARRVAGAELPALLGLVQKSLVRARGNGAYDLHEMVRGFAEQKLAARGEREAVRAAHGAWVLELLTGAMAGLAGQDQAGTLARLEANLDNIRAGWRWAVEARALSGRAEAIQALAVFHRLRSRFSEGAAAVHAAVAVLEGEEPSDGQVSALATALCQAGWFDLRLGRFDQSWRAFRRSAALIRDYDLPYLESQESDPVQGLAMFAYGRGEMDRCEELARGVLERALAAGRRANQYAALSLLGRVARYDGRKDEAWELHTRAHALVLQAGDDWNRARIVYELGMTALDRHRYDESRRYFEMVPAIFDDLHLATHAQNGLGTLEISLGQNEVAAERYVIVLRNYRQIGDDLGAVDAVHCLGRALVRSGRSGEAAGVFAQGLQIAATAGISTLITTLLVDVAELLLSVGQAERAATLLGLAQTQPTWAARNHGDVARNLERATVLLSPEALAAGLAAGRERSVQRAVAEVLAYLVTVEGYVAEGDPAPTHLHAEAGPVAATAADAPGPGVVRVLVVDAHEIMRQGLVRLLGESGRIEVAGEAGSGARALELATVLEPDVVLLDFTLPDLDGVEVTRRLLARERPARVLMLTSISDEARVRAAIEAGVTGYLLKDIGRDELIEAIAAAAEGRPVLHPAIRHYLLHYVAPRVEPSPLDVLTARDREILRLLAQGASNREIAAALNLTHGTVRVYVSTLLTKLGVADRTQAALLAVRHGVAEPG